MCTTFTTYSLPTQTAYGQVTLGGGYKRTSPTAGGAGGLGGSLVVGRWGYKYFLSGYFLLECNLMELFIISMQPDFCVSLLL